MSVATVSSKGQITLPAGLRRRLGIAPGDRVVIEAAGDAIVVRPAADLFALAGFLGRALPVEQERRLAQQAASAHAEGRRK